MLKQRQRKLLRRGANLPAATPPVRHAARIAAIGALPEVVEQLGLAKIAGTRDITLYHAKGCAQCGHTGYLGRFCILEMLPMTDPLRSLVMKHANSNELKAEIGRAHV